MKIVFFLAVAALLPVAALQAAPPARQRIRFDDGWKFHLCDAAVGEPDAGATPAAGPAAVAYDDAGWRTVHLPHDFVVEGSFDPQGDVSHGFLPKRAGWYRKTFTLPAGDRGKVLWLEFDGIYRNSTVWLNGTLLSQHVSGYTSFYDDISAAANYGGQNVLTVFADARSNEGWWYEGGGIYRHVWLTTLAPLHVGHWGTQIVATPGADFQNADLDLHVDLVNDGPDPVPATITNTIMGPSGNTVTSAFAVDQRALPGGGGQDGRDFHLRLPHPQLWSTDNPTLYTWKTTVSRGAEVVDEVQTVFGIRSLRWDPDEGFFLNGRPFKIQGTCNHQDFAGLGVALPDHVQEYKVRLLKAMGSNALRFSHQPMAPELLDACDRLGMVVMDENRRLGDTPEILGQVESLVRRDRNHPCVILWSMCNEEGAQGTPRGRDEFSAMKEVVLKWDRTRPVTCAMHGGFGQGISLAEEIQGFNYHVGAYDDFHRQFPRQPCFGSETASERTTRGEYADDKARGYVSNYRVVHESAWTPIAERRWMAGGFVWTGFDYRGEPSPYQWPCVNSHFGIMDTCGFPKDSYYYYLGQWGQEPVAHILPHWNWPGREGQEIAVWVDGNAAKYDLLLNGVSQGVQAMPPHSHLEWKVAYAPGLLEARGYDDAGEQVATDLVATTGAPARLRLEPDQPRLLADGEDVVLVRCAVLDAQGRVVPTAGDEVNFMASGPARVAGVGNGDPSDHEPDRASQRHAFHGQCLAIVQSTGAAGGVTVTATAPGLEPATIELAAAEVSPGAATRATPDFHGYVCHDFRVDGCDAKLVEPHTPLPGRPWVWRTLFWGVYPGVDLALLKRGFHVAYVGVGNTFGSPAALKHFDAFYATMVGQYRLSDKPALEGLSRGGLYAYRWASEHPDKVGCIYGDAPVCDMKSWPGGRGIGTGSPSDWALAIQAYGFGHEQELIDYPGNPIDTLAPLAIAGVPIIHVCGDADLTVPPSENTDIVRERYILSGGDFSEIVKQGCGHHPHGLKNPAPVADFIVAHCAGGAAAVAAARTAPAAGTVITLAPGEP